MQRDGVTCCARARNLNMKPSASLLLQALPPPSGLVKHLKATGLAASSSLRPGPVVFAYADAVRKTVLLCMYMCNRFQAIVRLVQSGLFSSVFDAASHAVSPAHSAGLFTFSACFRWPALEGDPQGGRRLLLPSSSIKKRRRPF